MWKATTSLIVGFILGAVFADDIRKVDSFQTLLDVLMPLYTIWVLGVSWDWFFNKSVKQSGKHYKKNEHPLTQLENNYSGCVNEHDLNKIDDDKKLTQIDSSKRMNMSGRYKLISNEGMDDILTAEGFPWYKRSAILRIFVTQRCEHDCANHTIDYYRLPGAILPAGEYHWFFNKWVRMDAAHESGRIYFVKCEYVPSGDGIKTIMRESNNEYILEQKEFLKRTQLKVTKIMDYTLSYPDGRVIKARRIFDRIGDL